ncbi:DUF885 family protein [Hydrocarboniphaga sp.]|uniref:DUF885 domain-containing protein n=1 Tax=Hydrocarboniphaga sp. TaxID=2033016 RepID=UPI00263369D0|nr:DUF885 domain-containing protein [Hydrocarboniphaga sp.]
MKKLALAFAAGSLLLMLAGCKPAAAPQADRAAVAAKTDEPSAALQKLFDEEWQRMLADSPLTATYLGDPRYNDRWDDLTPEAFTRRQQAAQALLDRLKTIDRAALPAAMQLNYELFKLQTEDGLESYSYGGQLLPVNQRGGLQTASEVLEMLRFDKPADYQNWIKRLQSFGAYTDQTIALMRLGMAQGRTYPRVIMQRVTGQIARQIVADPKLSPFYAPFSKIPADMAGAEALRSVGESAIREQVLPAYRRFQAFFEQEYLPACAEAPGLSAQPRGAEYYAYLARHHTTTTLTPDQIHDIGLKEVARIRAGMEKIKAEVGFKGDLHAFFTFLRTDPRFFYKTPQQLFDGYTLIVKRIDPELVRLFGKLPRTPYGVRPIPDISAPDTTTAYYQPPAADGSRAGYYYVNLYKPETRPKWEMEALSAHESVPGHHLQLALQQELGEMPAFRKSGEGFTAYVEGWGLYSESLGGELGLYKDPYSKFGQLTYEMWRAVRLVVDTGIHAKGWTRQQAIDYFADNAAKTPLDIANEIDRYMAMPGQALAYKIGELKIKELRARAESRLGDKFDVRAFHDTVLASGAVPLQILEQRVDAWIDEQAAK